MSIVTMSNMVIQVIIHQKDTQKTVVKTAGPVLLQTASTITEGENLSVIPIMLQFDKL